MGYCPIIVLLLQTSQESGEGHPCPPHCHHHLFFVYVRDSMTWLLSGAKSNTLAVCLECLQAILGSNFQKSHMRVTFGKHDVVIAIMKYQ